MEKVVRDGMVAVLISRGYGAGWSTWNSEIPELLFHPSLVSLVEAGKQSEITQELCIELLNLPPNTYIYCGGAGDLQVEWVEEGTQFNVHEYDGYESLQTHCDYYITA